MEPYSRNDPENAWGASMGAADDKIRSFIDEIASTADAVIASGRLSYLADVGTRLGGRSKINEIKATTGLTLSEFVEAYMADRFRLVAMGGLKSALVMLPVGQENLLVETQMPRIRNRSPDQRRFTRNLWLAFATPCPSSERHFNPTTLQFVDGPAPTGDNWIEIPKNRLRSPDDPYDWRSIIENIRGWLEDNSFTESDFTEASVDAETARIAAGMERSVSSVLDLLLDALDHKQLQSVSMPLDVIETLRKTRR